MRRLMIALCLTPVAFGASATDIATETPSALYLNDVSPPTPGQPRPFLAIMGDRSVLTPTWHLDQWKNPEPIGNGQNLLADPGTDWNVQNSTTGIHFYHAPDSAQGILEHTYQLSQNGTSAHYPLNCNEFDLLLEANGQDGTYTAPGGTVAAASTIASSGPLNALSVLAFKLGLNITYETTQNICTSSTNYASYVVTLSLVDAVNHYSMLYQIALRNSRGASSLNLGCPGYPLNGTYCYLSSIDKITDNAVPQQSVGAGRVFYNVNVLTAIENAISATPDPNTANWSVTGMYFGQIIQGGMVPTSLWDGVTLAAY